MDNKYIKSGVYNRLLLSEAVCEDFLALWTSLS